jgi:hypothetical protein
MNRHASASSRGWQNSALHREVDNRHARWVFKFVVGVALALTPFAVYLLQTMSYVQTSYAIEGLRGREARLLEAEHRFSIERSVTESLPVVEKRAGNELGLERPPSSHVIVVYPADLGRTVPPVTRSFRPPSR